MTTIPSNTMSGAWLENGTLRFRKDIPIPHPTGKWALIRVRQAGICATDLELARGYLPFTGIPGHEFVGDVVHSPVQPELEGQRVVGRINLSCGDCFQCRNQRPEHCDRRKVLGIREHHGAFAEYLSLPLSHVIPVPHTVSDNAAVFAEPLAAAMRIQEQAPIHSDTRVLLLGAGRLGQLIARSLVPTDCSLQVLVRYPRQKQLLEKNGIQTIQKDRIPERRFDVVIESTGAPGGFALACDAVRPGGTIVLKSTYKGALTSDMSVLVVNEITIIGSRCGSLEEALGVLEAKKVAPGDLIDQHYPLSQLTEAFEKAAAPGTLKILLRPDALMP